MERIFLQYILRPGSQRAREPRHHGSARCFFQITFLFIAAVFAISALAQSQPSQSSQNQNQPQNIPDAPSAGRPAPAPSFPADTAPAPKNDDRPVEQPQPQPTENSAPPPAPPIVTIPPGTKPAGANNPQVNRGALENALKVNVSLVVVPVTVKDSSGRLVEGLLKNDFTVLENGQPQRITLFTSDPFPLSVALVVDSNLPNPTLKKINDTLPALTAAFSDFDEVGVFSYGDTVQERLDFSSTGQPLTTALKQSTRNGRAAGPPIVGGPIGGGRPNPTVNNQPFDRGMQPEVQTAPRIYSVLNDAILQAAMELSKRDRTRRKIVFVISDGRENGSNASYSDVLKVLLSNNVSVYAIAVDAAAIPIYKQLGKLRIPGFGYANILGKYVSATGGQAFAEFTQDAIEEAYSRVTLQARNQYTLGYNTRSTVSEQYRSIEVRVHRPGIDVFAKDGYYPLPPRP